MKNALAVELVIEPRVSATSGALAQLAPLGMDERWECNDRATVTRQTSTNRRDDGTATLFWTTFATPSRVFFQDGDNSVLAWCSAGLPLGLFLHVCCPRCWLRPLHSELVTCGFGCFSHFADGTICSSRPVGPLLLPEHQEVSTILPHRRALGARHPRRLDLSSRPVFQAVGRCLWFRPVLPGGHPDERRRGHGPVDHFAHIAVCRPSFSIARFFLGFWRLSYDARTMPPAKLSLGATQPRNALVQCLIPLLHTPLQRSIIVFVCPSWTATHIGRYMEHSRQLWCPRRCLPMHKKTECFDTVRSRMCSVRQLLPPD